MDYNAIDKRVLELLQVETVTDQMFDDLFIRYKNRYISPNEIFLLTFNNKINRNKLVTYMFKYKIKTTYLGIYVLSMYEKWVDNNVKLNIYIPGKTYAIIYDGFNGEVKDKLFMYGTLDNFIVMKRMFLFGKLIVNKTNPYFKRRDKKRESPQFLKNDHDNPLVHPKKNKKRGMFMSDGNLVRLYNGPVEEYFRFDYLLYHKEGDIIEGVNDEEYNYDDSDTQSFDSRDLNEENYKEEYSDDELDENIDEDELNDEKDKSNLCAPNYEHRNNIKSEDNNDLNNNSHSDTNTNKQFNTHKLFSNKLNNNKQFYGNKNVNYKERYNGNNNYNDKPNNYKKYYNNNEYADNNNGNKSNNYKKYYNNNEYANNDGNKPNNYKKNYDNNDDSKPNNYKKYYNSNEYVNNYKNPFNSNKQTNNRPANNSRPFNNKSTNNSSKI